MEELTLVDLKYRLGMLEETYLVELLQITSEQLVQKFEDIIEDRFEDLQSEIEELEDADEDR